MKRDDEQTCLSSLYSLLKGTTRSFLCFGIKIGSVGCVFLIVRSLQVDLPPAPKTLTRFGSSSFQYPHTVTLEGVFVTLSSHADIPSLTTVALSGGFAFTELITVYTKSSSTSARSFLDITSALQEYVLFIVSFTHYSSYFQNWRSHCGSTNRDGFRTYFGSNRK